MNAPNIADQPSQVRLTSSGLSGTVEVDGADISKSLHGYTLEHRVGQPPLLVLYANPAAGPTVFEGLAHVAVADTEQQDLGQEVASFLGNIDAAALEATALERDDLDGSRHELTRAILTQLADWAQGRT